MFKYFLSFLVVLAYAPSVLAEAKYEYGVGAVAVSIPTYPGSKEQSFYALPLPYFYYKDEDITLDREGLIGNVFEQSNWKVDISFSGGIPVNSDDTAIRAGMPDLDWTFEAGPRLLYYFAPKVQDGGHFRAELYVRAVFATDLSYLDSVGYRAGLSLDHEKHLYTLGQNRVIWSNHLSINWANGDTQDYFYGVSSQYANASRPIYKGESGYAGAAYTTTLSIKYNDILLSVFSRYQNFLGATVVDSPLLQKNANVSIGIGAIWVIDSNR